MSARLHHCGEPMYASMFAHNDLTPQYRSQPIAVCPPCDAWEPRDGWTGPLPAGWNGQAWTEVAR